MQVVLEMEVVLVDTRIYRSLAQVSLESTPCILHDSDTLASIFTDINHRSSLLISKRPLLGIRNGKVVRIYVAMTRTYLLKVSIAIYES